MLLRCWHANNWSAILLNELTLNVSRPFVTDVYRQRLCTIGEYESTNERVKYQVNLTLVIVPSNKLKIFYIFEFQRAMVLLFHKSMREIQQV